MTANRFLAIVLALVIVWLPIRAGAIGNAMQAGRTRSATVADSLAISGRAVLTIDTPGIALKIHEGKTESYIDNSHFVNLRTTLLHRLGPNTTTKQFLVYNDDEELEEWFGGLPTDAQNWVLAILGIVLIVGLIAGWEKRSSPHRSRVPEPLSSRP